MAKEKLTEVARSYSYKLNVGNFESRDFFCSQKREVPLEEAEATSRELIAFCREQVERDVEEYKNPPPPPAETADSMKATWKKRIDQRSLGKKTTEPPQEDLKPTP